MHAALENPLLVSVGPPSAGDRLASEIHDSIRPVNGGDGTARKHDDIVPVRVKTAGERSPQKTGSASDDNSHVSANTGLGREIPRQPDKLKRYAGDCGVEGRPNVPSTTSTKFLSSRTMKRLASAIAKFSRASRSVFKRALYVS